MSAFPSTVAEGGNLQGAPSTWDVLRVRGDILRQAVLLGAAVSGSAVLFLLVGVPPAWVLMGLGGAFTVALTLTHPALAVAGLVFSFFFGQGETAFTIAQGVGTLALGAGILVGLARRETVRLGNLAPWFAAWGLWLCCSYFYGRYDSEVTQALRNLLTNFAIYALVIHYFPSVGKLRALILLMYVGTFINACVAIGQWVGRGAGSGFRATGVNLDANYLGSICICFAVISVIEAWCAKRRSSSILWLAGGAVCFFAMLLSASRTAHIATLVFGAFLFAAFPRRRILVAAMAVLLAGLYPYAPVSYRERVGGLLGEIAKSVPASEQHTLNVRGYLVRAGMRIWRDHPWIGTGVGSFKRLVLTVGYNPGIEWKKGFAPHNMYIGLLAEGGILGLLLYVPLLGVACMNFIRGVHAERDQDPLRWRTGLEASAFMLVHLIMSLTIPIVESHTWFLAMAMGVIVGRQEA